MPTHLRWTFVEEKAHTETDFGRYTITKDMTHNTFTVELDSGDQIHLFPDVYTGSGQAAEAVRDDLEMRTQTWEAA